MTQHASNDQAAEPRRDAAAAGRAAVVIRLVLGRLAWTGQAVRGIA